MPLLYRLFSPRRVTGDADDLEIIRIEDHALQILRGLLLSGDKPLDTRFIGGAGASKALLESEKIGLLGQLLCDWPNQFCNRMYLLYDAAKLPTKMLLKKMQGFGSVELSAASMTVRAAIAKRLREVRRQRSAGNGMINSILELMRVTELNPRTIIRLIRTNQIQATVKCNARYFSYEISAEEANRIRLLYSSSISLRQAATYLGCSEIHVNMFARADAFPVIRITPFATTWRFEIETLDRFLLSLEEKATIGGSYVGMDAGLVPLGRLVVKTNAGMPVESWVRLARRILASDIPLFKLPSGRALSSIAIRRTDTPRRRGS